jgi:hypothetical protein
LYFKIGFWDGLSPHAGGGLFFVEEGRRVGVEEFRRVGV